MVGTSNTASISSGAVYTLESVNGQVVEILDQVILSKLEDSTDNDFNDLTVTPDK